MTPTPHQDHSELEKVSVSRRGEVIFDYYSDHDPHGHAGGGGQDIHRPNTKEITFPSSPP